MSEATVIRPKHKMGTVLYLRADNDQFQLSGKVVKYEWYTDEQWWYQLDNGTNFYPESKLYTEAEYEELTKANPADQVPLPGKNGTDPTSSVYPAIPVADLMEQYFAPRVFLVDNLIAKGDHVMLGGRPKSGKSWFGLQMAKAIDTGTKFLERSTRQGKVLYIALEDGQRRFRERCHILKWKPKNAHVMFDIARFDGVGGLQPGPGLKVVEKLAPNFDFILIDTLIATLSGRANENDNTQMGFVGNEVARIAHDTDTTILVIHHTGKGAAENVFDLLRGASALRGAYDVGMILERKQNEREAVLHVESRDIDLSNMTIQQTKNGAGWECLGNGLEIHNIRAGRKAVEAMVLHGDGVAAKELAQTLKVSHQAAHSQLTNAEKYGYVYRKPDFDTDGKPSDLWYVSDDFK